MSDPYTSFHLCPNPLAGYQTDWEVQQNTGLESPHVKGCEEYWKL